MVIYCVIKLTNSIVGHRVKIICTISGVSNTRPTDYFSMARDRTIFVNNIIPKFNNISFYPGYVSSQRKVKFALIF